MRHPLRTLTIAAAAMSPLAIAQPEIFFTATETQTGLPRVWSHDPSTNQTTMVLGLNAAGVKGLPTTLPRDSQDASVRITLLGNNVINVARINQALTGQVLTSIAAPVNPYTDISTADEPSHEFYDAGRAFANMRIAFDDPRLFDDAIPHPDRTLSRPIVAFQGQDLYLYDRNAPALAPVVVNIADAGFNIVSVTAVRSQWAERFTGGVRVDYPFLVAFSPANGSGADLRVVDALTGDSWQLLGPGQFFYNIKSIVVPHDDPDTIAYILQGANLGNPPRVSRLFAGGDSPTLFQGGGFDTPRDITITEDGQTLIITDNSAFGFGALFALDIASGALTLLAQGQSDSFSAPVGVATTRCEPWVIAVNSTADQPDANPGDGLPVAASGLTTLRAAVMEVNARQPCGGATILLSSNMTLAIPGAPEENAATGDLDLRAHFRIRSEGPTRRRISANGLDRLFDIKQGGSVILADLQLQGGDTTATGSHGAMIRNSTETLPGFVGGPGVGLAVIRCEVSGNRARFAGAIVNRTSACFIDSHFFGNQADTIGVYWQSAPQGRLVALRCAFTGNSSIGEGSSGAAALSFGTSLVGSGGWALLENCTIHDNTSVDDLGAIGSTNTDLLFDACTIANNTGGGLRQTGPSHIRLRNTVVAHNNTFAGPTRNFSGPNEILSEGHNLVSTMNSFEDSIAALPSDLLGADPMLATLANNGGATPTLALLPGSPAIDAGSDTQGPAEDQRRVRRPIDGTGNGIARRDIGAFEAPQGQPPCPADVTGDGVVNFADLNLVLSNFGCAGQPGACPGDTNHDGIVNFADLNAVLTAFGTNCG